MKTICVLMSSYNGTKYLREQIDSILSQENVKINLLVRDDGSSDNTWEILEEYRKSDERVNIYSGDNIGPANSFIDLICESPDADYYAFSDQDDVWDTNKLYEAISKIEKHEDSLPVLYYSNLRIVDENLRFFRLSHSEAQVPKTKYSAIVDNMATGCTMVFNKKCRDLVKDNPPQNCTMHDAWLFLLCSIMGELVYDDRAFIMYRQHGNNVIGTYLGKKTLKDYYARFVRLFDRNIQPRYYNILNFFECYKNILSVEDTKKVLKMVEYKKNVFHKLGLLFDKDIRANNFRLDLRYRILILLGIV